MKGLVHGVTILKQTKKRLQNLKLINFSRIALCKKKQGNEYASIELAPKLKVI